MSNGWSEWDINDYVVYDDYIQQGREWASDLYEAVEAYFGGGEYSKVIEKKDILVREYLSIPKKYYTTGYVKSVGSGDVAWLERQAIAVFYNDMADVVKKFNDDSNRGEDRSKFLDELKMVYVTFRRMVDVVNMSVKVAVSGIGIAELWKLYSEESKRFLLDANFKGVKIYSSLDDLNNVILEVARLSGGAVLMSGWPSPVAGSVPVGNGASDVVGDGPKKWLPVAVVATIAAGLLLVN